LRCNSAAAPLTSLPMNSVDLEYFMEDAQEIERLERKTDPQMVLSQARWAGLHPGMRVADIGCGPGLTSKLLHEAVQPGGQVVGIDFSVERISYARQKYQAQGLDFEERNFFDNLTDLGQFDFVWARFVLEFHRQRATALVTNLDHLVRPGGTLCLVDLDYNCLTHEGLPSRLKSTIQDVVKGLEETLDFDPYAGRKLYTHLYDLGYADLRVEMHSHHLIFGELKEEDRYNWERKVLVAARRSGCDFAFYDGDFNAFAADFSESFMNPRRFTYTPLIACCGRKGKL